MRKLIVGIVIVAIGYGAGVVVFAWKGKGVVERRLEKALGRKVTIAQAGIAFPFTVVLKQVEVFGLLKIDEIAVYPALISLLKRELVANRVDLISPYLIYEKSSEARPLERSAQSGFICKQLNIKYGKVDFIDRSDPQKEHKVSVRDVRAELSVFSSGQSSDTVRFNIEGIIPERDYLDPCRIIAEGWVDLAKKDAQISLNVIGLEVWYVYPYLSQTLKLEKVNLEKASLNFTGNIFGLNNDLTVDCRLELSDISFKLQPAGQPITREEEMALLVLDVFHSLGQGKVFLDFTVKTRLDQPEIDYSLIGKAFEEKLSHGLKIEKFNAEKIVVLPRKFLKSTFMGAVNISRSVIGGTKQVGTSLKNEILDTFITVDTGKGKK